MDHNGQLVHKQLREQLRFGSACGLRNSSGAVPSVLLAPSTPALKKTRARSRTLRDDAYLSYLLV